MYLSVIKRNIYSVDSMKDVIELWIIVTIYYMALDIIYTS